MALPKRKKNISSVLLPLTIFFILVAAVTAIYNANQNDNRETGSKRDIITVNAVEYHGIITVHGSEQCKTLLKESFRLLKAPRINDKQVDERNIPDICDGLKYGETVDVYF